MKKFNHLLLLTFLLFLFLKNPVSGQYVNDIFLQFTASKTAEIPPFTDFPKPSGPALVTVNVDISDTVSAVSKFIYGTNANIYSGRYNTQTALVNHLKLLKSNVIRYPGGLHSNEYFWNAHRNSNGTYVNLPNDLPPQLLGSSGPYDPWWVAGSGTWEFDLEDFYDLIEQTGDEPLITVNYSYARYGTGPTPVQTAAHLAADWVRYDNGRTKFWEVGNENVAPWASGYRIDPSLNQDGQPEILTTTLYAQHFKVFADSMRAAAAELGHTIYIGAQHDGDFFAVAGDAADWVVVHDYFTPYGQNSNVNTVLNSVTNLMNFHAGKAIDLAQNAGTQVRPVGMTEWNIFAEGSGQRTSFVNGMHGVMILGEAIRHGWGMANRWDIANGYDNGNDMGLFNRTGTAGDGVSPVWNPFAPFFYLYFFQKYFGDHMVAATSSNTLVVPYASVFSPGETGIVIVNKSSTAQNVEVKIPGRNFSSSDRYYFYSLTGGSGNFSKQVFVNDNPPDNPNGGPINNLQNIEARSAIAGTSGGIAVNSPPLSVQFILVEQGELVSTENPIPEPLGMNISPNPGSGEWQVRFEKSGFERLEIFDATGRSVYECPVSNSEKTVQVQAGLPAGFYLVKATGNRVEATGRLVAW